VKLYKFRSLGNCIEFERIEKIIKTNKFWCSKVWDLNDPMEGVYKNEFFTNYQINNTFTEKNRYLICSFSGEEALNNPILWGYYANGFRGVAIEIEIEENEVSKIIYKSPSKFKINQNDAKKIITRKLTKWRHEHEYRYLKYIDNIENRQYTNEYIIGKIENIYFGNPYGDLNNTRNIMANSESLKKYFDYKDKLEEIWKEYYESTPKIITPNI
jgi:hypothetical protein